jgi:CHAD domain-containing protein
MSEIGEYANKQISSAIHLLEQYTTASNEDVLHQLRVCLKKVKAVLDYLRTLHPKKIRSLRKKLQVVFHAVGSVREAQLRLKWLKGKRVNYLIQQSDLDHKIKEEEELLFTQKEGHCKKLRTVRDELDRYLKEVEETALLEYAFGLKEELAVQITNIEKKDWHELRKLIKQLLYAQHWIKESHKLKLLSVSDYKKIDQLQETIGVWHDAVDLLLWLTAEQLFLSRNALLEKQFARVFAQVQKDIEMKEKAVIKQLQTIKKPARK